jgi:hypothetical protein
MGLSGDEKRVGASVAEIFWLRTKEKYSRLSTAQRTMKPFAASVEMTFLF